jgi:hypothetical protein
MTHEDSGHYGAKHPPGTRPDPALADRLRKSIQDGTISCARAHRLAAELGCPPSAVGKAIDLLEGRIVRCQLGLFGHSPQRKIVQPALTVAHDLEKAIREALTDGHLTCAAAWQIADQRGSVRLAVAEACEALGIRIRRCQLGAFG